MRKLNCKNIISSCEKQYRNDFFYFILIVISIFWGMYFFYFSKCFDIVAHNNVAKFIMGNEFEITDVPLHILAYPLYHITVKCLVILLNISYEMSSTLVLVICNVLSVLLYRKMFMMILSKNESSYYIDFVSLGTMIFMPIPCWLTDYAYYKAHNGANPLHNPTILFVRPIGIVCIICFLNILYKYEKERISIKKIIPFAIAAWFSVLAKPSFAFTFFISMGIVCLIYIIKNKDITFGFNMFLGVLPSVITLIAQLVYVKSNSAAVDCEFIWGGTQGYSTFDIIKVTIGVVPAAFILIQKNANVANIFAWLSFIVGWLQAFTMSNGETGDYEWGYILAMQFVTAVALILCMDNKNEKISKWRRTLGILVFVGQIIAGIVYYLLVIQYGDYMQ